MVTLNSIILPDDIKWDDEFKWNPVGQQVEVSMGGSLFIEESVQAAGRPITLKSEFNGNQGFAVVDYTTLQSLMALANNPPSADLTLTLLDGRTIPCRFRYDNGPAVEAEAIKYKASYVSSDLFTITIRLIGV